MDKPPPNPGMIGPSPSERGLPAVPADPALHAGQSAREWSDVAETFVRRRMKELGIPKARIGSTDHRHGLGDESARRIDEYRKSPAGERLDHLAQLLRCPRHDLAVCDYPCRAVRIAARPPNSDWHQTVSILGS